MKTFLQKTVLVCGLALATTPALMAQTNPTDLNPPATNAPALPTGPMQVLGNIGNYFSNVDTTKTWTNTPVDLWTGANYQNNINTSAELGGSYDIWRIGENAAVAPEVVFRNAGVAGTLVSFAGGAGISLFHYDLKITAYLDAGDNLVLDSMYVEFGGRLKKKLTTSTYAGIGLAFEHFFSGKSSNTPDVTAYVGWTF